MMVLDRVRMWVRALRRERKFRADGVYVAPGTYIHSRTTIGRGTRINAPSHLGECSIGAFCAIGGRLVVRSSDHHTGFLNMQDWAQRHVIGSPVPVAGKSKGQVQIGHGVWIGDSVIVLAGVTIGDGAVIGAGAVVTTSVPAYAVAVGNPARVVRMRFSHPVTELVMRLHWWEWGEEMLRTARPLFELDFTATTQGELQELIDRLGLPLS